MLKPDNVSTQDRILQVACEVFAYNGFHNTTVRDICEQADVNVAAVNYHFGSKDKLYEAVCKHICSLSGEKGDPRFKIEEDKKPEERLKAFIHSLLFTVLAKDKPDWMEMIMGREMIEPTKALDIVIQGMIKPRFEQLYSIVKALLGDDADDITVRRCCLSVAGQCLYYRFAKPVIMQLHPQLKFDIVGIEELVNHISRFSLHAIKQYACNNQTEGML